MSFQLVKKVIHSDRVDGNHKLVLIILADYVNDSKGNAAWPALSTVALQAGFSSRHTRRIIRELEAEGVLKTIRQAGLRGTNKYVIDLNAPVDNSQGADTHVPPGADIHDTKGGHIRHLGADTHVPRIDKEHIRTDTLDAGAGSAQAPGVSLVDQQTQNSSDVARAGARDAPECKEHPYHFENGCAVCYTWQQQKWRKEPLA
jgi:hypothetical protein